MDLIVPSIAQRKAARRNQQPSMEHQPLTLPSESSVSSPPFANIPEKTIQTSPPRPPANPSTTSELDKESLIAIARTMGLELVHPKKIWIKHSYSVTPQSKESFSKYCDVLGIKMQDGLEDALQDWFKKKAEEFKAVSVAKQT